MTTAIFGPPTGPAPEGYTPVVKVKTMAHRMAGSVVQCNATPDDMGIYHEYYGGAPTPVFAGVALDATFPGGIASLMTRGVATLQCKVLGNTIPEVGMAVHVENAELNKDIRYARVTPVRQISEDPTGTGMPDIFKRRVGYIVATEPIPGSKDVAARVYVEPSTYTST